MDERDMEKINREIKILRQKLEAMASEQRGELEEGVEEKIASMRAQLKELYDRTKKAGMKAQNFVEENPWKAVGVATLVGLIIGMIISSKKRHD